MQLAWLYTAQDKVPNNKSRAQVLLDEGRPLPLPPNPAPELIEIFNEVGPGMDYGGMDRAPLTAAELQAWDSGVGLHLDAWEFGTLLDMSHHFVHQARVSKSPDAPPPWIERPTETKRAAIVNSIKSLLRD